MLQHEILAENKAGIVPPNGGGKPVDFSPLLVVLIRSISLPVPPREL